MSQGASKGVINVIELVIALFALFVSFDMFFPGTAYRNKWEDAYGTLMTRDALVTLDRTGKLNEYAYNSGEMSTYLDNIFAGTNVVSWYGVSGGIKDQTKIACNCTPDVVSWLNSWAGGTVLNNRNVSISFCQASIDPTDACFANSDALLVWRYSALQPYSATLTSYVSQGGGVVEAMNFTSALQVDGDSVQQGIFGLDWVGSYQDNADRCVFARTPRGADDIIYVPYKYFHHIPITLKITSFGQAIAGCAYNPPGNGTLVLRSVKYEFDTCSASTAWFDTNGVGGWDTLVNEREAISIGSPIPNIMMNYVNSVSSISVSFNSSYVFEDFLGYGSGSRTIVDIEPLDSNQDRVLVSAVAGATYYPAVILNTYGSGRVAWMQEPGAANYGDDEKALMLSLLLWASNKETTSPAAANFQSGYTSSYINVQNYDMFEMYKVNIGVGYPV